MNTTALDVKKMEAFREIINIEDENMLTDVLTHIRQIKKSGKPTTTRQTPPENIKAEENEPEKRMKASVTVFYK